MKQKIVVLALVSSLILSGCSSLSNMSKGGLIGAGAGAAVGAGVGALIGKSPQSTAIGAAVGTAVGATTGAIIGKQMDKAAEKAAAIENAKVEAITDANDLQAVKITFDSGILFDLNKSSLNKSSKDALEKFSLILVENPSMDVAVFGHTDNTGSLEVNQRVSKERAQSVADFLQSKGVPAAQIKDIIGKDFSDPIADNATKESQAANRRVEIFLYASEQMIKDAEAESNQDS